MEKEPRRDAAVRDADGAVLHIRPSQPTADEWKRVVAELPAVFREGLTGADAEKARALGLLAWAFEYENGPLSCWVEVEETGQQTVEHAKEGAWATLKAHPSDKTRGRILLWLQPRSSPAMQAAIRDRLEKNAKQTPDYFLALAVDDTKTAVWSSYPGVRQPRVPLWFGWNKAEVKETPQEVTGKDKTDVTPLVLQATEKGAAQPRGVKLALKAKRKEK